MTIIAGRGVLVPLTLLVALLTLSVGYYGGVAAAPTAFFGTQDVRIIGPLDEAIPARGTVPADLAGAAMALPGVDVVSPEVFALTSFDTRSVFIRGVEFAAFMALEGGRITSGRGHERLFEAVPGRSLADELGLEVGDRLLLPASLSRSAIFVDVVGIAQFDGPADDQVLVPIAVARSLANLSTEDVHVVRVRSSDRDALDRVLSSPGPAFEYSDVSIAPTSAVTGEPIVMRATLTNWGATTGSKAISVRENGEVVATRFVEVPARDTIRVELSWEARATGVRDVSLNPTFRIDVAPPTLRIEGAAASVRAGAPISLRVLDSAGQAIEGATLVAPGADPTVTNSTGDAVIVLTTPGVTHVTATAGERRGVARTFVLAPDASTGPVVRVTKFAHLDSVPSEGKPNRFHVEIENVGDVGGAFEIKLGIDGEIVDGRRVVVAPGHFAATTFRTGPLPPGRHVATIDGLGSRIEFTVYGGPDPRLSMLRERYAERAAPGATAPEAERYVDELLGNVRLAVLALSFASGALATAGAAAVLARHAEDRKATLRTLRALGASHEHLRSRIAREVTLWGAAATVAGIALGFGASYLVDASGVVRAFGHTVRPTFTPGGLVVFAVLSAWGITIAAGLSFGTGEPEDASTGRREDARV